MVRIALIQSPAWLTWSLPFGLTSAASFLEQRGFNVKCFDFNIALYNKIKREGVANKGILKDNFWDHRFIEGFWRNTESFKILLEEQQAFIDKAIQEIDAFNPDVIGFTVQDVSEYFSGFFSEVLRKKRPNVLIVWGGPHCFTNHQGVAVLDNHPAVDAVCTSVVSDNLASFVRDWQNGSLNKIYGGMAYRDRLDGKIHDFSELPVVENINNLPLTNYALLNLSLYEEITSLPVRTAKGCINRCAFCNESIHWGKYSSRDAEQTIRELKYIRNNYPQISHIWFADLLINGDIANLERLCDLMIEEKMNFYWDAQFTIRENTTIALLNKMKKAGCARLHVGLESGSSRVLKLMRKGYTVAQSKRVLKMIIKSGIAFNVNIIVGFPGEKKLDVFFTAWLLLELCKYKITPPIAICGVHKKSILSENATAYGIIIPLSGDWYLKDLSNTEAIRLRRKVFLQNIVELATERSLSNFLKTVVLFLKYLLFSENVNMDL